MKNNIRHKVKEELKRIPRLFLPYNFSSETFKSHFNRIKREFINIAEQKKQEILSKTTKSIDKLSSHRILKHSFNLIKKIVNFQHIPERFNLNRIVPDGDLFNSVRSEIDRLLKMNATILKQIDLDLTERGINTKLPPAAIGNILSQESFFVQEQTKMTRGSLNQLVVYKRSIESERYHPVRVELTYKKEVRIEQRRAGDVDIEKLQLRMDKLDWNVNYVDKSFLSYDLKENKRIVGEVVDVMLDLLKIRTSNDLKASEIHDRLAFKYFSDTPNDPVIGDLKTMRDLYQTKAKLNLDLTTSPLFSKAQYEELLLGRPVAGEPNKRGEIKWYKMDSEEDSLGFHWINLIENSQRISIEATMLKSGVLSIRDPDGLGRDPKIMLQNGNTILATLVENGVRVERMMDLDAGYNELRVNNEATRERNQNLLARDKRQEKIDEYQTDMANDLSERKSSEETPKLTGSPESGSMSKPMLLNDPKSETKLQGNNSIVENKKPEETKTKLIEQFVQMGSEPKDGQLGREAGKKR